uniref:Uncharacterized protein n=1 Tax=Arundo donax TaxID=35708 RepID=A0A0A9JU27_ARUDO
MAQHSRRCSLSSPCCAHYSPSSFLSLSLSLSLSLLSTAIPFLRARRRSAPRALSPVRATKLHMAPSRGSGTVLETGFEATCDGIRLRQRCGNHEGLPAS